MSLEVEASLVGVVGVDGGVQSLLEISRLIKTHHLVSSP